MIDPNPSDFLSQPVTADDWAAQVTTLRQAGQEQEALSAAAQALRLDPARADMWNAIGFMLLQRGRWAEAASYLGQAVTLKPDDAKFRSHYAVALAETDDFDAAHQQAKAALEAQPDSADALYMMGEILTRCAHYEASIPYYKKAREQGLRKAATFGQAFATFMIGAYDEGAKLLMEAEPAVVDINLPDWDGKPDLNLHLVLCGEYGFGDILQFIRYARAAQKRVGKITLSIPYHLLRLIRNSFPEFHLHVYQVPSGEKLPENASAEIPADAKAKCFTMNLMHLLAPFDTLASTVPYLKPDPKQVGFWQEKLAHIPRPRIGLAWSGNVLNQNNHNRSIPFQELRPLIDLAGPHLVSLQRGDERKHLENTDIFDASVFIDDFADAAAALNEIDLLITVCSAPAHLAGGMGKPAWALLAFNPDWRWLIGREDSIWYPATRLFRPDKPKNWAQVIKKACGELKKYLSGDTAVLKPKSHGGENWRQHTNAIILSNFDSKKR
jgi:tetratricopeptide (TPR) repeat protein